MIASWLRPRYPRGRNAGQVGGAPGAGRRPGRL